MEKPRRYLKKVGESKLRLFGWTPVLAAQKGMVECDRRGIVIVGAIKTREAQEAIGLDPARVFELGAEFRVIGEKNLESWLEENASDLNVIDVGVQGLIIAKWQKYFGAKKMPTNCTFLISGDKETGEPEAEEKDDHPVDMEA